MWAAEGGGWPLEGPSEVLLGFGVRYAGPDGSSATHHGIDLAADPGSRVRVIRAGTVTFAGSVPASGGGTMRAVTVDSGDVRISYLPLIDVSVSAGQAVEAGSLLGLVAASGDGSSERPHLHIGARVGTLYVDPATYLSPPVPGVGVEAEPVSEGVVVETVPAALPRSAGTPAAASTPAGEPVTGFSGVGSTVGAGASTAPVPGTAGCEAGSTASSAGAAGTAHTTVADARSALARPLPPTALAEPEEAAFAAPADTPVTRVENDARLDGQVAADRSAYAMSGRLGAADAVDRREALTPGSLPGKATAMAIACALGVALLWPVWRSVIPLSPDAGAIPKDVAALVGR